METYQEKFEKQQETFRNFLFSLRGKFFVCKCKDHFDKTYYKILEVTLSSDNKSTIKYLKCCLHKEEELEPITIKTADFKTIFTHSIERLFPIPSTQETWNKACDAKAEKFKVEVETYKIK